MLSKRGARLRVIGGYKIRVHKLLANDVQRWACTARTCPAFMKIDSGGQTLEDSLNHNHGPDSEKSLMRQRVANGCKRRATQELFERPAKLIRLEMTADALAVLTEDDLTQIRKSIYTARSTMRPPLPQTLAELHTRINGLNIETKLAEQFVQVNDDVLNIVMFSTTKNLEFMSSCTTILMDGTFYSCPKLFDQLFIVHARKKNVYIMS